MIGVFSIINVLLFIGYIGTIKTGVSVSEETVGNTVAILGANNVAARADVIPRKTREIRAFSVKNRFASPQAAADSFWARAQSGGLEYFNPQSVTIGENSFEYRARDGAAFGGAASGKLDKKSAEAGAKKIAALLGMTAGMTIETEVRERGGEYTVLFRQVYEGNAVLDTCLTFTLDARGVTRIYGENWLCGEIDGGGFSPVRSAAEILVGFAVSGNRAHAVEITDIQQGYFAGSGNDAGSAEVVPVWKISTDDGNAYYYDARNGDALR
jgi:hypothetical protein